MKTQAKAGRRLLTAEFIKLEKEGETVQGTFEREYIKTWQEVDATTGEFVDKTANVLVFETPEGKKIQLWEDGGLRSQADVIKSGQLLEIEYTGQKKLKSGFKCNQYSVYALDA